MEPSVARIVRRFTFDAGHRVLNHEGKCRNLHGHTYAVEVHVGAEALDSLGRVVDFSVVKERVGGWLDANWDHAMLLCSADHEARAALQGFDKVVAVPFNPTAENIAAHLLDVVVPRALEGCGVDAFGVVVWETPNCRAEAWS